MFACWLYAHKIPLYPTLWIDFDRSQWVWMWVKFKTNWATNVGHFEVVTILFLDLFDPHPNDMWGSQRSSEETLTEPTVSNESSHVHVVFIRKTTRAGWFIGIPWSSQFMDQLIISTFGEYNPLIINKCLSHCENMFSNQNNTYPGCSAPIPTISS
jgi:hypothetical protein